MTATTLDTAAPARAPDRHFKYWIIAPAIFLLLLVGLFPLIYTLIVSFQHLTMTEADTSFVGLKNYAGFAGDCDDGDPLIFPEAEEICN